MAGHIALLGDSIFDNRAYTSGEPDVVTHPRAVLPSEWKASLLAVDGARDAVLHFRGDAKPYVMNVTNWEVLELAFGDSDADRQTSHRDQNLIAQLGHRLSDQVWANTRISPQLHETKAAFSFQIDRVRSTMKKIIVLLAVAFASAIGTATMFVHLKPAIA